MVPLVTVPPDIARLDGDDVGVRIGDVDNAMSALSWSMRHSFFGGTNLSLLSQAYGKHLKQIVSTVRFC